MTVCMENSVNFNCVILNVLSHYTLIVNNSSGRHNCKDIWTDDMKLQLLGLYVQNAENVEERDDKTKEYARKKKTKNLKPIYKQSSIIVNGKSVRLDTYDLDAMSKKLKYQGLTGQPPGQGLLDLIDIWTNKTGLNVKDNVESFIENVKKDFFNNDFFQ